MSQAEPVVVEKQEALFIEDPFAPPQEPIQYAPVVPFEVPLNVQNFLTLIRMELDVSDPWNGMMTEAQFKKVPQQRTKLMMMMLDAGGLKDYRKHMLSALLGRTVLSQKEVSWREHSILIDAINSEDDHGKMVLSEIQKHLVEHASSEPKGLYDFIFKEDANLSDM